MKQRWRRIALAILVLAQPVASAGAWASMMAAGLETTGQEMPADAMPGCHEAMSDAPAADMPDCCDSMDGVACGMDCGTASPAVTQATVLPGLPGHGAWTEAATYAAPDHPTESAFKPPRTS